MSKTVVLVVASEGFQPTEYNVTKEVVGSARGVTVLTASDKSCSAHAKDGSVALVEMILEEIDTTLIDGLFLIGGPGALTHLDNKIMYDILDQMHILKKPFGAICLSPRILAKAGVLGGKKATGWDQDGKLQSIFSRYNVTYIHEPVVVDGNIVTANGPDAALEFGQKIVCILEDLNC